LLTPELIGEPVDKVKETIRVKKVNTRNQTCAFFQTPQELFTFVCAIAFPAGDIGDKSFRLSYCPNWIWSSTTWQDGHPGPPSEHAEGQVCNSSG
jgi:hypothetical protein